MSNRQKLEKYMNLHNLTIKHVAELTGLDPKTVTRFLDGKNRPQKSSIKLYNDSLVGLGLTYDDPQYDFSAEKSLLDRTKDIDAAGWRMMLTLIDEEDDKAVSKVFGEITGWAKKREGRLDFFPYILNCIAQIIPNTVLINETTTIDWMLIEILRVYKDIVAENADDMLGKETINELRNALRSRDKEVRLKAIKEVYYYLAENWDEIKQYDNKANCIQYICTVLDTLEDNEKLRKNLYYAIYRACDANKLWRLQIPEYRDMLDTRLAFETYQERMAKYD